MGRSHHYRVKALLLSGRTKYVLRWTEPTGRVREKTSSVPARKSFKSRADREAAELEVELSNDLTHDSEVEWSLFDRAYRERHLSMHSKDYGDSWRTVANHVETILQPIVLTDVDSTALSHLVGEFRRRELSESSIASYLTTLRSALNWAVDMGLLKEAPRFRKSKRAAGRRSKMRSRPVNAEEFDRFVLALRKVRPADAEQWITLANSMYWGGLRVAEAVSLSWDWEADFSVCLKGRFPMFRILSEGEKGAKDRLLPIAPEFAEILQKVPSAERKGLVAGVRLHRDSVVHQMSEAGRRAGIIVNRKGKTATSHDLRRSFGTRWAKRVMPADLQQLMRHASIQTTMDFYVEIDADDLASRLHGKAAQNHEGEILGGTDQTSRP